MTVVDSDTVGVALCTGVSRRIVQQRELGELHVVSGGLLRQHHCVEHVELQWSVSGGPVRRDGGTDELELLGRVSSGVLLSGRVGERDSADVCRGPVQRVGLGVVCELLGGTVRERVGADERKLQWVVLGWVLRIDDGADERKLQWTMSRRRLWCCTRLDERKLHWVVSRRILLSRRIHQRHRVSVSRGSVQSRWRRGVYAVHGWTIRRDGSDGHSAV